MKRIGFAGAIGMALVLGACGGGTGEEPAGQDTPDTAETAAPDAAETPAPEETPEAGETAAATEAPVPEASATVAAAAPAPAAPPAAFNQCKVCHAVEPGKHGLGPSLAGIYGTKAGDVAGFEFSSAMKESGLVWNDANLDRYLLDPRGTVPGTKMTYAGLKDAARRKEVIDYIKGL